MKTFTIIWNANDDNIGDVSPYAIGRFYDMARAAIEQQFGDVATLEIIRGAGRDTVHVFANNREDWDDERHEIIRGAVVKITDETWERGEFVF